MKLTKRHLSVLGCLMGFSSPGALRVDSAMRRRNGRPSWLIGDLAKLERTRFVTYRAGLWEPTDKGRAAVGLPSIDWPDDVVVVDCAGACERVLAVDLAKLPVALQKAAASVVVAGRIEDRPYCAACLAPESANGISGIAGGHPRSPDEPSPWGENATRAREG